MRSTDPKRPRTGNEWLRLSALLRTPEGTAWLSQRFLKVRDKGGHLHPLLANRTQMQFERCRGPQNIILKARQMGVSTWIAGRFLLKTILEPGSTTLMVAHRRESAEALFATVVRMWENLPTEMRASIAMRGRANAGQMTFPAVDSEFRIASASEPNAGRGLTLRNLHCSEVARWTGDAAEVLAGLRAALVPGGELILESTPNGAYGCFHAEWEQAEAEGVVRHFFPWWFEPSYVGAVATNLTGEEVALVAREGLTAEQIGFRRELARRFGALRDQEFAENPVTCFRASGSCFFERDVIASRFGHASVPIHTKHDGSLLVWLPACVGRRYVIGVDAAGGGSTGDFAAAQVIDEKTGMQCAELQARLSPRDLARVAAELAREYNGALLAVERNNHGSAVFAFLESEAEKRGGLKIYAGRDGMPGWYTDVSSRARMLSELAALFSRQPELVASERLLLECRSFVTDEHGRAAAARGAHDDLVMSMAIAQAVRNRSLARDVCC